MNRRTKDRTCICAGASLLAVLALATPAQAGERAQLVVMRDPSAAECPDARALRDAVGARLGYEPFAAEASTTIVVSFRREGGALRGTVQRTDDAGNVKGERALTSTRGDCEELASTTALTISILLDPRSGMVPPKRAEPEPVPDVPPPPALVPPPAENVPTPPAPTLTLRWSAAGTASAGTAPAPAVGVLIGAGIAHRLWSASLEFRADFPASDAIGGREARAAFLGGNVVPCAHFRRAYACAVLSIGAIQGEVVSATPSRHGTLHAMLGPRIGLSILLVRWLSLDGHIDASYALTSTTLRVAGADLWATSTLSALLGIGVVGRFP